MNDIEEQSKPDFFRFALCAAGLSALAVALTTFSAGADEPPKSRVDGAVSAAERAAATEGALRQLDPDGNAGAQRSARRSARAVAKAARGFEPVVDKMIPADWDAAGLDISKAKRVGDKLVQSLPNGGEVYLTIDPDVQDHLEKVFANNQVPHGGVTLVEPSTGRVLAMVSHSQQEPAIPAIARKSNAPSASVFKIITAAALIESEGVDPYEDVCYHGGRSSLTEMNIKGSPARDSKCANLEDALAWSINSIMAKLSYHKLEREDLEVWTERFGYNTEIPFELPVEMSTADILDDPFERARTAAGFWHTYLSPLHGAMIGASVANDGVMMRPTLIDAYVGPSGDTLYEFEPKVFRRVMAKSTARTLAELLQGTAEYGTARKYFSHSRRFPNHLEVGGKTGTLSNKDPYLGFTWFVGFGRNADGQSVGVGGLACNTPRWRIKGSYAASEALRKYFDVNAERAKAAETVAAHP
ncbi:MAG: penicillin-binding transpeptidase domain-containing protein [Persicimonas sp.]